MPIFPLRQLVIKLSFFISRGLDAHCLPGKHDIRPSLKKNKRLLPATSCILLVINLQIISRRTCQVCK